MSIENSPQIHSICKHYVVNLGNLYFFKYGVVIEFNEGVNVDFNNFSETKLLIKQFYEDRPFGLVSNRINSYSIVLPDAEKFNSTFNNAVAYAIVTYSSLSEQIYQIENHFFKFNRKMFKSVENAIEWVKNEVNKQ